MPTFRRLMTVVLAAGAAAGLLLAAVQAAIVVPLIQRAETYERAEHVSASDAGHGEHGDAAAEWQPAEGFERTAYTVLGTVLTGIAFAALLFGAVSALGLEVTFQRGLMLGLAGFACCALAPALGLPPKPPGAAAADLRAAQLWWVGTAAATAAGIVALARARDSWIARIGGAVLIVLPHVIGAPRPQGSSPVPTDLSTQFAIASVGTQAVFWLLLGGIGGHLYAKAFRRPPMGHAR